MAPDEVEALSRYLASSDFEEVTVQLTLWRLLRDAEVEQIRPTLRDEVRQGLRHAVPGLAPDLLTTGADVVFDALLVAVANEAGDLTVADVDSSTIAVIGHLAAAAVSNTRLLERVGSLAEFHRFGQLLREQVTRLHCRMRLPHLDESRSVTYPQLYVEPQLRGRSETTLQALTVPGMRTVVLGNPGAGKSTLASRLAWRIAQDGDGRVPFLLVLREFGDAIDTGGRSLVAHLERMCADPYNLVCPPDAVEYLLGNGRAVVVLDGIDELVDVPLRKRFAHLVEAFAHLVEAFAHLYPSVPIIATSRRIGYIDAPLTDFTTLYLAEFGDSQVTEYVTKWFSLDEATAGHVRASLAEAFLRESTSIRELCANPLLLALLCAMYSREHFIPMNLTQVYEKCALMLFDQWDRMRGLGSPTPFHGRLRSAVGLLAWEQLTERSTGRPWPREHMVRALTAHLESKGFDVDIAEESANDFVDFCSGRSWILTDTGAGMYAFTHRTFMEYFAADHLVRTTRTVEQLWDSVEAHMLRGRGDIVGRIALQLYDKSRDEGASEILRLALAGRGAHLAFDALRYVHPVPDVTAAIVCKAVNLAVMPLTAAFRNHHIDGDVDGFLGAVEPLYEIVEHCLPVNRAVVMRAIRARLTELAADPDSNAALLLWDLAPDLPGEDVDRPEPWATILTGTGPIDTLVTEHGTEILTLHVPAGLPLSDRDRLTTPLDLRRVRPGRRSVTT